METMVAADVMRMRRGKRQYIDGRGMVSLPVESASDGGESAGFIKGKRRTTNVRGSRSEEESEASASRPCTIDHYVKALSRLDWPTGHRILSPGKGSGRVDDFDKASKEAIRQVHRAESSDLIHITKPMLITARERRSDVACNSGSELNAVPELSRLMRAIGTRINRTVAANSTGEREYE